jgi:hypothetical protein
MAQVRETVQTNANSNRNTLQTASKICRWGPFPTFINLSKYKKCINNNIHRLNIPIVYEGAQQLLSQLAFYKKKL